jgi:hypothetical protein
MSRNPALMCGAGLRTKPVQRFASPGRESGVSCRTFQQAPRDPYVRTEVVGELPDLEKPPSSVKL